MLPARSLNLIDWLATKTPLLPCPFFFLSSSLIVCKAYLKEAKAITGKENKGKEVLVKELLGFCNQPASRLCVSGFFHGTTANY